MAARRAGAGLGPTVIAVAILALATAITGCGNDSSSQGASVDRSGARTTDCADAGKPNLTTDEFARILSAGKADMYRDLVADPRLTRPITEGDHSGYAEAVCAIPRPIGLTSEQIAADNAFHGNRGAVVSPGIQTCGHMHGMMEMTNATWDELVAGSMGPELKKFADLAHKFLCPYL